MATFYGKNGKERLWEELAKLDIVAARKIPINNSRRVIRALEVIEQTGRLFLNNMMKVMRNLSHY